jgi:GT2 family glycosyltransferase
MKGDGGPLRDDARDHSGVLEIANPPSPPRERARPEVSILIVAYRSRDFILDCISSIYAYTRNTAFEVLVIDNSNDGAADRIAEHAPAVRLISTEENLGFGRGNNRLAAAARADRFLLLNPDTRLRSDAIDRLAAFARRKPDAGAWGGLTVTPDGRYDAANGLVIPNLGRLMRWALGKGNALSNGGLMAAGIDKPAAVDVLSGSFMMVRRDVWAALGGFDESYFLYSEEIDFFLRLKRLGLEAWATPEAVVIHDVGSGDRHAPERLRYRMTGQAHFVRTHWSPWKARVARAAMWIGAADRWLVSAILGVIVPGAADHWRSRRRGYGEVAWRPWRWWGGYSR